MRKYFRFSACYPELLEFYHKSAAVDARGRGGKSVFNEDLREIHA